MSVLVTGAAGMLGLAVVRLLAEQNVEHIGLDRAALDVTDAAAVERMLHHHKPRLVIHCAAYTRVDDAESNEAHAFAVNANGAAHIAAACRALNARMIYPSTDYVFDGRARTPYAPGHRVHPLNAYGRSKAAGEHATRAAGDHLVVRTSWLYGRGGRNLVRTVADRMAAGEPMRVVNDQHGAPSWADDVARMTLALGDHAPAGIYHVANSGTTTWYQLALEVAALLNAAATITPCSSAEYPTPARRPGYSVLDCRITDALIGPARPWAAALRDALATGAY